MKEQTRNTEVQINKEDSFSQERVEERKKELTERKESRLAKVFKEKSSEAPFYYFFFLTHCV